MKERKVVAVTVAQDYLVATKYALKLLGVYYDSQNSLRWHTYDVLLRSDNKSKLLEECFKAANKMNIPCLKNLKSTSIVSDKHIAILKRRKLL